MTTAHYFRPAIPLLLAFICGILAGSELTGFEIWAWLILGSSIACCLLRIRRNMSAAISPIVMLASLGYLAISPWVSPGFPADHIVHYADTGRWDIAGRLEGPAETVGHRTRIILQTDAIGKSTKRRPVRGKLRVSASGHLPALAAGDSVSFKGRIRLTTNFKNPAGFDYRRYMAYQGIWATASTNGKSLLVVAKKPPGVLRNFLNKGRRSFSDLVENSADSEAQAVLKALVIGDRSQISPQTRQRFNRAGVGHLLAISGLHIGIVAAAAFFFFHKVTVRVKPLLWRAWTRKTAAVLSLVPVIAYGLLAGMSPSTQRAVIMVTVFLMTFIFQKEQDSMNTLALAALVILMTDPPSLFSISFQLSFTAVLAIVYGFDRMRNRPAGQPPIQPPRDTRRSRFTTKAASFFMVSLFAVCGSLPLAAYYFNQISLVGLAANMVVVPLVGFITIPLGLVALFAMPLSMPFASLCLSAGAMVLSCALGIIKFFAALPFAAVHIVTPNLLEIGCFYILFWALLNLHRRQPPATEQPHADVGAADHVTPGKGDDSSRTGRFAGQLLRKMRFSRQIKGTLPGRLVYISLVLVGVVLAADTGYWAYQRFWRQDLRVTVIDVGNGFASLLELPGGHTLLVDGGGFSDNAAFDVGASILAPYLWRKKIRTIDTLILSHPNSDHLNGLIYIADNFHVKNIWTNHEPVDTFGYAQLQNILSSRKIFRPVIEDIPHRIRFQDVELVFLYPPPDFLEKKKSDKWRNPNNNSLVVKVTLGSTSFLFPGDIMADAEAELVRTAGSELSSTVLMAPHHGSSTSSSDIFIAEVNPEVTIVSSGRNTRYNFPNPAVIKRYQKQGCTIWRTDINGAIRLTTDGRHLAVHPFER